MRRDSQPEPALPTMSCSLLKLVFDVPVAQAFLIEEDASIGVPNSPEERWIPYPRW